MASRIHPWLTDTVDLAGYRRWDAGQVTPDLSAVQKLLLFVGYPRSGHSLVGSILDAHPQAVVAHELDLLAHWERGAKAQELSRFVLYNSQQMARIGRYESGYGFRLPGQGVADNPTVLGDKKGGRTAHYLLSDPEILWRFQESVPWPIHLIHVVRDPRDNVSTMARRHSLSLERALRSYVERANAILALKQNWPSRRFFELHLESLIECPEVVLCRLCQWLDLAPEPGWAEAVKSLLYSRPKQTRTLVEWGDLGHELERLTGEIPFLEHYLNRA